MGEPGGRTGAATPRKVGQIALTVGNVDRAVAFYRDVVGLELLFRAPPNLAFLRCGEVRLMLSAPEGEAGAEGAGVLLYYEVDDLEAAHRRMVEGGTTVVRTPETVHRTETTELRIGFYEDGEGHAFGLMHEGPPEAT